MLLLILSIINSLYDVRSVTHKISSKNLGMSLQYSRHDNVQRKLPPHLTPCQTACWSDVFSFRHFNPKLPLIRTEVSVVIKMMGNDGPSLHQTGSSGRGVKRFDPKCRSTTTEISGTTEKRAVTGRVGDRGPVTVDLTACRPRGGHDPPTQSLSDFSQSYSYPRRQE